MTNVLCSAWQAITLIVTHRTDDMSKLPPVQPPDQAAKPKQAAAAARPKLALLSARRPPGTGNAAPPVPDMSAADVAPSTLAVELPPVAPEECASLLISTQQETLPKPHQTLSHFQVFTRTFWVLLMKLCCLPPSLTPHASALLLLIHVK